MQSKGEGVCAQSRGRRARAMHGAGVRSSRGGPLPPGEPLRNPAVLPDPPGDGKGAEVELGEAGGGGLRCKSLFRK